MAALLLVDVEVSGGLGQALPPFLGSSTDDWIAPWWFLHLVVGAYATAALVPVPAALRDVPRLHRLPVEHGDVLLPPRTDLKVGSVWSATTLGTNHWQRWVLQGFAWLSLPLLLRSEPLWCAFMWASLGLLNARGTMSRVVIGPSGVTFRLMLARSKHLPWNQVYVVEAFVEDGSERVRVCAPEVPIGPTLRVADMVDKEWRMYCPDAATGAALAERYLQQDRSRRNSPRPAEPMTMRPPSTRTSGGIVQEPSSGARPSA